MGRHKRRGANCAPGEDPRVHEGLGGADAVDRVHRQQRPHEVKGGAADPLQTTSSHVTVEVEGKEMVDDRDGQGRGHQGNKVREMKFMRRW